MFLSSMVKLRIAGTDVTVKGPQSVEKLSNVTGFGQIGISLHTGNQPSGEQKKQAANNLTALTGVSVLPLPQKISETVTKHFPDFKDKYAGLDTRLDALGLPGADRIKSLQGSITEILKGDASDATFRLGTQDAPLYVDLQWAKKVADCLTNKKTETTIRELQQVQRRVKDLPTVPVIEQLRTDINGQLSAASQVLSSEEFFERVPDLKDALAGVQQSIEQACQQFEQIENARLDEAISAVRSRPGFAQLTAEQRDEMEQRFGNAHITNKSGIQGIQEIVNEGYRFLTQLTNLHTDIDQMAADNVRTEATDPQPEVAESGKSIAKTRTVKLAPLPRKVSKAADLDEIIDELQTLKKNFNEGEVVELIW